MKNEYSWVFSLQLTDLKKWKMSIFEKTNLSLSIDGSQDAKMKDDVANFVIE